MGEFVELPGLLNAIRAIIDSQVGVNLKYLILTGDVIESVLSAFKNSLKFKVLSFLERMFLQVSSLCVLPNEVVVSLAPDVDVTQLYFPEPDGVLRLKVVEARNLENRDIQLTKKMVSDPYCEIHGNFPFSIVSQNLLCIS